jgi:Adenylate and Guanylate cyclase catalytic domain
LLDFGVTIFLVLILTYSRTVRDPSQVFMLLESVYCAFDAVATRMKVFKVETVGDCYVAGEDRTDLTFLFIVDVTLIAHVARAKSLLRSCCQWLEYPTRDPIIQR